MEGWHVHCAWAGTLNAKIFTPLWLLGTVAVLLGLMLALQRYHPVSTDGIYNAKSLAATGFIILAAFSMGEFFQLMRMPALLGYICAGILFGPKLAPLLPGAPEALFGTGVIEDLALINVLIVGVIGTMGGGELKIAELKHNIKTIGAVVLLNTLIALPLSALTFYTIAKLAPGVAPFVADLTPANLAAATMMAGIFGTAMSPTVTLAVIQETRARGPMTSLVLGVVVLADLLLVAMFLVGVSFSKLLVETGGITSSAMAGALPAIAAEFGYALLIGVATGLIIIVYLRFVAREHLLFTVALIFGASYVCRWLHAETLLAFLTAGFVVQNFSRRGHDMILALERISLPVFVIYFMTQAAQLELTAVTGAIGMALALSIVRAISLIVSSRTGARLTGAPEGVRRHLWLCIFSLGSVDLVLASLLGQAIPTWGPAFQTVIMAVVIIHIILGPWFLKAALDWSGESEQSRRTNKAEAEAHDPRLSVDLDDASTPELPKPTFESEQLTARTSAIRDHLVNLHRFVILDPIESRALRIRAALDHMERSLASLLERSDPTGAERQIEYERDVQHAIRVLERVSPCAIDLPGIDRLLGEVRGLEPFASVFRIPGEAHLFVARPGDGRLMRLLKLLRRARRFVRGRSTRSIPLGRLWRFYVELSIPLSLSRAVESAAELNEDVWRTLVQHVRLMEDLFRSEGAVTHEQISHSMATLRAKVERAHRITLDRFSRSLVVSFADFIAAAERAGTLELAAFRYRPSARFDRARRAEQRLRTRLRQEQEIVSALCGWIALRHQISVFAEWSKRYRSKLVELLNRQVHDPCRRELDSIGEWCRRLLEEEERKVNGAQSWSSGLDRLIRPALARAVQRIQQILHTFGEGAAGRELHELLVVRIAGLSPELRLPSEAPSGDGAYEVRSTITIPLREWFMSNLALEIGLRLVELRERVRDLMRSNLESLEEIQQILEFNLLTAQRELQAEEAEARTEVATGGVSRALRTIGALSESLRTGVDELAEWIDREAGNLVEKTVRPLHEHRLEEIRRTTARRVLREKGETWTTAQLRRLAGYLRGQYRRYAPSLGEAAVDLRALVVDQHVPAEHAEIRSRLRLEQRGSDRMLPAVYRRIFAPAPLEIAEFYVSRPELEESLLDPIQRWVAGTPASILVRGDRGNGKRSLVQHVITRLNEASKQPELPVATMLFDEKTSTEAELVTQIGGHFTDSPPESFEPLIRLIQTQPTRRIVIIENGEKIFWRSEQGLDMCRRFLRFIGETNHEVLWIVLMGKPAASWLETMLGIFDYFTHAFEVPPLSSDRIEEMIHRRHRVSGFRAIYQRPSPRVMQWLTHPLATSEAMRRPQEHFFDRLVAESGGNPMMALLYWLEAARIDSEDNDAIRLDPPSNELQLLHGLSLGKRLLLAALVQHGSLSLGQLERIVREEPEQIRTEVRHLERLGFVEAVGLADSYRLKPLAEAISTRELRRMNLL